MSSSAGFFVSIWIKFFFLFTPFFALSMFLIMTRDYENAARRKLALQVTGAVGVLCLGLFFFGNAVFSVFGITLDAFRIGAGALLFLSAVGLVQSKPAVAESGTDEDISVVPLAMPIIIGPATTGTLLVLGAEIGDPVQKGLGALALLLAVVSLGMILWLSPWFERAIGRRGLNILSKVTGLVLAALASQMILTGVHHFIAENRAGSPPAYIYPAEME